MIETADTAAIKELIPIIIIVLSFIDLK